MNIINCRQGKRGSAGPEAEGTQATATEVRRRQDCGSGCFNNEQVTLRPLKNETLNTTTNTEQSGCV